MARDSKDDVSLPFRPCSDTASWPADTSRHHLDSRRHPRRDRRCSSSAIVLRKGRRAAGRARLPREPPEPRQPHLPGAGRDHADERHALSRRSGSASSKSRSTWRTSRRSRSTRTLIFSDVFIETTGGHNPIVCHGHTQGRRGGDEADDREVSSRSTTRARNRSGSGRFQARSGSSRVQRAGRRTVELRTCALDPHRVKAGVDHQHFGGDGAAGRPEQEERGVGDFAAFDRAPERRAIAIGLQDARETRRCRTRPAS